MRTLTLNRLKLALLVSGLLMLALPPCIHAQEDMGDIPLGDVARSLRKKADAPEMVIDNDNLSKAIAEAESRRAEGSSMVFSVDPGGNSFQVSSPDVTCSLSFSAKTSALLSDPLAINELPRNELTMLDGPAMIDGDTLQVSIHNGTSWELRELVIGLTIIRQTEPSGVSFSYPQARMVPALAGDDPTQVQDSVEKQPDVTILLPVKGSAAPSTTTVFRVPLNFELFPGQEWHWAIVRARGIPPQSLPATTTTQLEPIPEQLSAGLPAASPRIPPLILPPTVFSPVKSRTAAR
ncbi:MAG: hypothetical protein WAM69_03710 [Candidatus Sulfotelmatobacter sp.]